MQRKFLALLLIVSAFLAIGCTTNDSGEEDTVSETDSQADAAELYAQITEDDDYRQWELMPGTEEMGPGQGIHGEMITVYVSDDALSALENNESVMPDGSMVLKEGYNSGGELQEIVIMQKIDGYDPENNDWFWATYSADGEVVSEGRLSVCYDCHSGAEGGDYIYTNDPG
ncbi:MAG: hypothetical protein AWU59_1593 [Methanolobus sp. T82-4]|jgi:hypothetical protein|nr:MAG: hypothetical protein AWU59_1593 [Methanolobus sp. T82-4]